MKYLEFKVSNMTISRVAGDKTALISGAVNYFGLHFDFDEEFAAVPGIKAVEFLKNKNKYRKELIDGACAIPNELLKDKQSFEMRVVAGTIIGTQWTAVAITESGAVLPDEPEEEAPEGLSYVMTIPGEYEVALVRATTNGMEYSTDGGETWNSGVSGVPEVPSRPKDAIFGRTNGDWVRIDKMIEEAGGGIAEVKVDGTALTPVDGAVDIDLSEYAKTEDVAATYATQQSVSELQTLTGTASQLTALDYSETDTTVIVTKINEIISALQARGIATE